MRCSLSMTLSFPRTVFEERGYQVVAASNGGYAGVATISRAPLEDVTVGIPRFDEPKQPGRRLLGRIGELWIDNLYVPTCKAIGKVEFLEALRDDYDARFGVGARLVLAGDFNICFDARDLESASMITDAELLTRRPEDRAWRRMLESARLRDCFRLHHDDGGHYTWSRPAGRSRATTGRRLDYVFASEAPADALVEIAHDREPRSWSRPSDHLPGRARFDVTDRWGIVRRPGASCERRGETRAHGGGGNIPATHRGRPGLSDPSS